jgi:hypothetical protein
LVRFDILNTTDAAVVCVRFILPALKSPNAIVLALALLELKIPVDKVIPSAIISVPNTNAYVLTAFIAYDLLNVTVPLFCVNVAVAPNVAVPPYVKEPVFNTKLTEVLRVPVVRVSVGPFSVNVVQLRLPVPISKLPPL